MVGDVLTHRELNRATLARQLLLERSTMESFAAVEHLVGLQAQNPLDPYLALWSRLQAFDPDALGRLLEERRVVRIVVMRGTVHLVSASDALELRPLMQPVLDAELSRHSEFAPRLVGVDVKPVLEFAVSTLADKPLSGAQLRPLLADRFPELDAPALAYACRCLHPLVQIPPRGVWGRTMQVTLAPLEAWVGRPRREGPIDRPCRDALLRSVRTGERRGCRVLVTTDGDAGSGRAAPPRAAPVSLTDGKRAVRLARRAASRR